MEPCPVLVEEELLVENVSLVAEGSTSLEESAAVEGLLTLAEEADIVPEKLRVSVKIS